MPYILSAFADEASPDFSEQMRVCSSNSIKWIEVRGVDGKNISDLTPASARELKKKIDANGFHVSSIGSPFGKINILDEFEPHMEKFKRTIEVAHILDTKLMRVFSFYTHGNTEQYSNEVFNRLEQFVEHAGGIQLCHENEKGIFGDTALRCRKIFDRFNGKIKLIFDPANFVQCGEDIEKAYALLDAGGAIEYFHIKDCLYSSGMVVPPGGGDGKIEWLLNSFYKTDKNVFLSIEPHLKVFDGYAGLENGENSIKQDFIYESAETAFSTAVLALKSILCANAYRQTKDIERGYGEWIK